MQKMFTLIKTVSFKRTLLSWFEQFSEALESPEKRQYRILKKFISE
jgi:hypothetical protein